MKKLNRSGVPNPGQHTKELLQKKPSKTTSIPSDEKMNLIYQLRESQLELKLQNDKLNLALSMAEDAIKLYDLTPAGNFTISKEGEIINLNICGSEMLSKKRVDLLHSRFGFFVSEETRPIFNLFISKVFESKAGESCDVTLSSVDKLPVYVHLTGIASENGEKCLVNMVDITELKQLEMELAFQIEEKAKLVAELVTANKEKTRRAIELVIANKEKAKRVAEFIIANKEKAKRAAELILAKRELAYLKDGRKGT